MRCIGFGIICGGLVFVVACGQEREDIDVEQEDFETVGVVQPGSEEQQTMGSLEVVRQMRYSAAPDRTIYDPPPDLALRTVRSVEDQPAPAVPGRAGAPATAPADTTARTDTTRAPAATIRPAQPARPDTSSISKANPRGR